MTISLLNYLTVATTLFLLGIWGLVLNRKNIIIMLMSIELMLLAINLNLIVYSMYLDDVVGQIYALFILTVAAAESAIGLAILVSYFRVRGTIAVGHVRLMKG
jgi:NADH-quinone oxidoreductase subunit K